MTEELINAVLEVAEIYAATDEDGDGVPLSGADVVQCLGEWIERHGKLLDRIRDLRV